MKKLFEFHLTIFRNGRVNVAVNIFNKEYSLLNSLLWNFPSSKELSWIKKEIDKEAIKDEKSYTGQNTLIIGVKKDQIELSHTFDRNNVQSIPSNIVEEFIEQAIDFYKLYNSGGIPITTLESKKGQFVIIPNKFVNEEFWNLQNEEEED